MSRPTRETIVATVFYIGPVWMALVLLTMMAWRYMHA